MDFRGRCYPIADGYLSHQGYYYFYSATPQLYWLTNVNLTYVNLQYCTVHWYSSQDFNENTLGVHHFSVDGDLSRGLLQFARGKPLGEQGFAWLQIHFANLYDEKLKSRTNKSEPNANSVKKYTYL